MTEATRKAIVALVAVDETATVEERDRVAFALSGRVKLYTITETAKVLGLSRPTVYQLVRCGKLATTAGGQISDANIQAFLQNKQEGRAA